jgi:hypothetical protein
MNKPITAHFLKDVRELSALPRKSRYAKLCLYEYPFDHQLLSMSRLYRESRKQYLALGGRFSPRISSLMRSLSAQDLFANDIDYTPSSSELSWFAEQTDDVYDPAFEIAALEQFNSISVFHEQNHRIIWRLLPPAPKEERDLIRYLNFAESLVVMLDLALGDEIDQVSRRVSQTFERMKVIYRTGGKIQSWQPLKEQYRNYLLATLCATYFILELVNPEDVLKAVDFALPGQKKMNREAVSRALDINELFTRITNPEWQKRSWTESAHYLPEDPLDFEEEFVIGRHVLTAFGL